MRLLRSIHGSWALVLAVSAAACGPNPEAPSEVVADVVTPEGAQSGQVSIDFILSGDSSEVDVDASYSINGGLTFHRATPADGGDGTRDLSVSGMGEFHTFVWDSAKDLAGRRVSGVRVRISPEDGDSGRSEPFAVHNALWVTALQESRRELNLYSLDIHTGELTSRNTVSTPESRPCDVLFFEDRFLVAHHESDLIAMFKVEEGEEQEEERLVESSTSFPRRPVVFGRERLR